MTAIPATSALLPASTSAAHALETPMLARSPGKPVTPVRRLHALTALRFVAAAMIVIYHSPELAMLPDNARVQSINLSQAVSFFFVLSGFILTYVYPKLDSWKERKRFLVARFARIWPAHIAAFVLVILLLHHFNRLQIDSWSEGIWVGLCNVLLLHAWLPLPVQYFAYNAVSWTISTEFSFYLFFPLLIWRWEKTWWWKLPATLGLAYLMVFLSLLWHLPQYGRGDVLQHTFVSASLVYINPLARLFEFTLGMTTALLFRAVTTRWNPNALIEWFVRLAEGEPVAPVQLPPVKILGTLIEIAALAIVAWNMHAGAIFGDWAQKHVSWIGEPGGTWLKLGGAMAPSFALLVLVMGAEWGWISYALSAPLGIVLGEISFSVYLTHQILLKEYYYKYQVFASTPRYIVFPIYCAIVLILSHLIWAAIERPFRVWLIAKLNPSAAASPKRRAAAELGEGKPSLKHTLETPAGRSRKETARKTFFGPLLNPGPKVILVDALLLLAIFLPVYIRSFAWQWREATPDDAAIAAHPLEHSEVHDLAFGDNVILHAARVDVADGYGKITLVWQSPAHDIQLRYRVWLYLFHGDPADPNTKVITHDFKQDASEAHVKANQTWVDVENYYPAEMDGVTAVGIALSREQNILSISPPPAPPAYLDHSGLWGGNRLIMPIPHPSPALTQPIAPPPAPATGPAAPR